MGGTVRLDVLVKEGIRSHLRQLWQFGLAFTWRSELPVRAVQAAQPEVVLACCARRDFVCAVAIGQALNKRGAAKPAVLVADQSELPHLPTAGSFLLGNLRFNR